MSRTMDRAAMERKAADRKAADRKAEGRSIARHDIGHAAAALDRLLSAKSAYSDLVEAARRLVALRDLLIAERRDGVPDPERRLDRLNAILSLVAAAEYPLDGVRRERIESARRELAKIPA